MAFRTFHARLANLSDRLLLLEKTILDHGDFTPKWDPPLRLEPGGEVMWRAESGGILTGTMGRVYYRVDGVNAHVSIGWNVPAYGNNDYWLDIDDPSGNLLWFPREFGFPVYGGPGLHAFPPAGHTVSPDPGPVAFPPGWNMVADANIAAGIRYRPDPISIRRWLQFLGVQPNDGVRTVGSIHGRPNLSVRNFIGPPQDWSQPIMP